MAFVSNARALEIAVSAEVSMAMFISPKKDRIALARELQIPTGLFTRKYCRKVDGIYQLIDGENGECSFLKDNKCSVYKARPTQCRTWPFWPEVMDAKGLEKRGCKFLSWCWQRPNLVQRRNCREY